MPLSRPIMASIYSAGWIFAWHMVATRREDWGRCHGGCAPTGRRWGGGGLPRAWMGRTWPQLPHGVWEDLREGGNTVWQLWTRPPPRGLDGCIPAWLGRVWRRMMHPPARSVPAVRDGECSMCRHAAAALVRTQGPSCNLMMAASSDGCIQL